MFIDKVTLHLKQNDFEPETLGVTFHDISAPLESIRDKMSECWGLISIAFRRAYVEKGTGKLKTDLEDENEYDISEKWVTSPYCQIEPAMAFQLGIPILIFREEGVIDDGILEKGVTPYNLPVFDLSKPTDKYFESGEGPALIQAWKNLVLKKRTKKLFEEDDIIKHIISYSICKGRKLSSDELYNMFSSTINNNRISHSGQRWNNYNHFLSQLKSRLIADDIEEMYKIDSSLMSDYIHVCQRFFK